MKQPRILKDLFAIHAVDREHKYEVVKTIVLPLIDYENFITDMTVERQYLEDNAHLCEEGDIWKCLLIRRANKYDGVLVIPLDQCWVKWAAYYTEEHS